MAAQIKAYAYLRVSGRGQIDGDGFKRQREDIDAYAEAAGYEIVGEFREEGVSGTTTEADRPAFAEMVTAILKNGVRTVIIEGMDRLARELRIQEHLVIYLASKDIALLSARTGENITAAVQGDPMKKALVQIQGVFAELEKSLLVRKLRVARDRARKERGKCEGRKSTKEKSPEVIKRIRALRRKRPDQRRRTYAEIAIILNEEGFRTVSGRQWTAANVQSIVKRF